MDIIIGQYGGTQLFLQSCLESSFHGNKHIGDLRFTLYPVEVTDILIRRLLFALDYGLDYPVSKDFPVEFEILPLTLRLDL